MVVRPSLRRWGPCQPLRADVDAPDPVEYGRFPCMVSPEGRGRQAFGSRRFDRCPRLTRSDVRTRVPFVRPCSALREAACVKA
jgi:hypothetical protein